MRSKNPNCPIFRLFSASFKGDTKEITRVLSSELKSKEKQAELKSKILRGKNFAFSAIHLAAWNGHQAISELLLMEEIKHHKKKVMAIESEDSYAELKINDAIFNFNAMHILAWRGHCKLLEIYLRKCGVGCHKSEALIFLNSENEEQKRKLKLNLLHIATIRGHLTVANALLKKSALGMSFVFKCCFPKFSYN